MSEPKSREFKMPWGKYKGETLEEIYIENGSYLDWVLGNSQDENVKQKIRECEKEMRNVRISP